MYSLYMLAVVIFVFLLLRSLSLCQFSSPLQCCQCRDDVHHSFTVRLSASLFTVARCLLTAMMALAQPRRRRRRRRLGWFGSCV